MPKPWTNHFRFHYIRSNANLSNTAMPSTYSSSHLGLCFNCYQHTPVSFICSRTLLSLEIHPSDHSSSSKTRFLSRKMRSIAGSLRCQKPHLRHFSSSKPRWRLSPPRRRLHLTDIDYTTGVVGKAAEGNRFSKPHYDVSGRSLLCYPSLSGGGFASFSPTQSSKDTLPGTKPWLRDSTQNTGSGSRPRSCAFDLAPARPGGLDVVRAGAAVANQLRAVAVALARAHLRIGSPRDPALPTSGSPARVGTLGVSGSTHAPCLARELAQCTRTPTPHRQALLDSRKCIGAALARRDWIQRLAGSDTRVGSDAPRGRSDWCARVCREERAVGEVAARIGADSGDVAADTGRAGMGQGGGRTRDGDVGGGLLAIVGVIAAVVYIIILYSD
ncbi:hypothetical protein C8R43DRAFT_1129153 [Mycena crocata]|nr:hypothetical protein C8R43DRAFT_1129150 [Mycena crocata]KAJ7148531.1 hypothetical protein C8R43DRAFT_1129153 [Mycena crocata]